MAARPPQRPQARGGIVDAKDIRYILRVVGKNWYFVVVSLILASILSYLYSYKLPIIYGASTQLLLKDRETYDYQAQMYKSLGYAGLYGDLVNQKRVLTSYDLINTTLSKLDFDISYFIVGRFKTSQVHGTLPFSVELDATNPRFYEKPLDMKILDLRTYELSYDRGGEIVSRKLEFGKPSDDGELRVLITLHPYVNQGNLDKHMESDYRLVRHDRHALIAKWKNRVQVTNHDYTTILQITVEDEVATRAKAFLDTLSRVYIDYTLKSEFDINSNTVVFIDRQLEEVSRYLEMDETEMESYKESKDILNLSKEEQLYFSELVRYDNRRREMLLELGSLDALQDYLENSTDERLLPPAVFITDDAFLRQTLGELYSMQMERTRMLFAGKEENISVRELDRAMDLIRGNLHTYIRNAREAVQGRMQDVEKQIRDYEVLIRNMPESQRDMMRIQRRLQVNEKMYLFLLEKRASTLISRASIVPQTKVIEKARSLGVVRPDKLRIFYVFVLVGLVVALLVVFMRVVFYDRIENAEQLKELVQLPVYGEIIHSDKAEENYVVVDSDPKAAITECFRTVRTNLEYVRGPEDQGGKVVMLTSYRPNEGKTFCSVNLSAILAKAGKRVLLLELDLHKPKVGQGLNMTNATGLSNMLVGKVDWRDVVLPTQYENFHVILSGPTPPNASELVLSEHLGRMLIEARRDYDYVIMDTPPVGLITDALLMMRHCDVTLFVMNTRFANKDHVNNAIETLEGHAVKNVGLVLNGVRMKKSKYYYNTNYGYGYRYAYGYGSGYGYGYGYGYGRRRRKQERESREKH
ncbi:MAG: polysaccharide biosynthesis tyrosine autokinase [Flavobacteriales bacterium]|nr:polysaccharide biosynthesis tyrosine autokinase [Flavobacteriales bacterium]